MKILIINNINPAFFESSIHDFIRAFSQVDDEIIIRNTLHTKDLIDSIHDANTFDAVIVAGDDVVISKISFFLANTNIPILPYPSRNSNLIAQNLFLPNEPHALAKIVRDCKTLDFDVGQLWNDENKWGFICNAGAGYGTKISKDAIATRKLFGPLSYIGAALSNFKPQISKYTIQTNDKTIETEAVGVLLLNFAKIGLDLSITHQNRPRDGLFDIVVLKGYTALNYVPALTAAAIDRAIEFPDRSNAFDMYNSNYVKISAEPKMEVQIDGYSLNINTPFEAKILNKAAKFIVDNECLEHYLS